LRCCRRVDPAVSIPWPPCLVTSRGDPRLVLSGLDVALALRSGRTSNTSVRTRAQVSAATDEPRYLEWALELAEGTFTKFLCLPVGPPVLAQNSQIAAALRTHQAAASVLSSRHI
jgi:hypothetical protein